MTKASGLLLTCICLLMGLAVTWLFVSTTAVPSVSGAFEGDRGSRWVGTALLAAYGFAVTLLGVVIGAVYRRLLSLRKAGLEMASFKDVLKDVACSIDFQIGVVGSPLVFGLLWQAIGDISVAGLTVIALQNGFTSHAILDQLVPAKPNAPTAPTVS